MRLKGCIPNLLSGMSKKSPEIMTGLAIVGGITTVVLAVKATPKAMAYINKAKEEKEDEELKTKDKVKACWKCYIPTVVMGGLSICCAVSSTHISNKRNAALATAYGMSEAAFLRYKDKVVETLGPDKEQKITDEVSKDIAKRSDTDIGSSDGSFGEVKCIDEYSGRAFWSSPEDIQHACNIINKRLRNENTVTLNELYYELGLESIPAGDIVGWDIDKDYCDVRYKSALDKHNKPCLVASYRVELLR